MKVKGSTEAKLNQSISLSPKRPLDARFPIAYSLSLATFSTVAVKIFFSSLRSRTYPHPHFQNDGATVECSAVVLLQVQLAIKCFRVEQGWIEKKRERERR